MPLSRSNLRGMAAAASTIPERLSSHVLPGDEQRSNEKIQTRLYAWCLASAGGDWQDFEQRLAWDGLDLAGAKHLLTPGIWSEETPLPGWMITLQEALKVLETNPVESVIAEKGDCRFLDGQKPLPFEELLAPFVLVARRHFIEQAGSTVSLLADAAHLSLQRHLLQTLTSMAVPTLHAEYAQSRERAQATGSNEQRDEMEWYQHFLRQMCQGGLAALLRTYSVLARLLATTCDLWVEAHAEFVQRLHDDWPDLEQIFSGEALLGQVTQIQPALSDAHTGRRCVMALTFADGSRLIYKPRSVGIEEAYYRLLSWCNAQGSAPPFKILRMLSRAAYGWMEFVTHEPCQNREARRRYYQRAGMLLCLIYLLGGMDCSYDQLIAHGEQPVLVDASSLLQPYFRLDPQQQQGEDWEQEFYTVLHTGLLSGWQIPPTASDSSLKKARAYTADISGFAISQQFNGSTSDARLALSSLLKYGSLKPRAPLNAVTLTEDCEQQPEEHLYDDLSTGFQHLYRLLLQQREALLAADSPLQTLKTQCVAIVYRDRLTYAEFLPDLLAPEALRDAVVRSLHLELLGLQNIPVDCFMQGNRSHWWAVFAAERQALLQGDIPRFSVRADSDGLGIAPDQEVPSCLYQPSFDLLLRRLEQLSNEDMRQQLSLLQQALRQQTPLAITSREIVKSRRAGSKLPDRDALMTQALAIADELARNAIKTGQDSVVWVNPGFSLRSQHCQLLPTRYGFADGISGIAFFMAAVAQITGISGYRELARAALHPLRHLLRNKGKQLMCEIGLGAGPGLGSVVYAFTRISRFLDEPELLADAREAASLISADLIANDHFLDVFVGTAGALLGLLALYEVSPEQAILERAMQCGRHLLRTRTQSKAACLAWPTLNSAHMTGFAHGTAGIVYALLRLYAVSGDASFLEAAEEGLRYEERAFVPEVGNWMETIGEGQAEFRVSWCHGAPGIGLARIGGLPMLDNASIRQDIERALQTTRQFGFVGPDHLCCGTCGRAEMLLTAARRLGRPELADVAAGYVEQVLTRAAQRGAFAYNPLLPRRIFQPQLFQGASGIGYTLLRLAQPDALPSVLLWE